MAPAMVSQNTPASNSSMSGKPCGGSLESGRASGHAALVGWACGRTAPRHALGLRRTRRRDYRVLQRLPRDAPFRKKTPCPRQYFRHSRMLRKRKPRYRTIPACSAAFFSPSNRRSASHRGAGPPVRHGAWPARVSSNASRMLQRLCVADRVVHARRAFSRESRAPRHHINSGRPSPLRAAAGTPVRPAFAPAAAASTPRLCAAPRPSGSHTVPHYP